MNINDIEPENEDQPNDPIQPDDMGDDYRAMAWEAGWACCPVCNEWKEKHKLVEVNGYLYCPEHTPHFPEANDGIDYETLWKESEAFINGLADEQKSEYDDILSQWKENPYEDEEE